MKNFLANKNVVTILGAILIVIVLYLFYNWRVNQAIEPVRVPYAKVTIGPRTEITSDMIGYVDIQQTAIKGNILTNINEQIVGKYTNINVTIPEGSLFYRDTIVKFDELADSFLINIPDGMVAYNFKVDVMKTYGNSIYPGNYVDIYFKGIVDDKIKLGKLVENVKVLAVKDSNGNHVFENTTDNRTPNQIIFAVTNEMHELLRTAEYMSDTELILVPTNVSYKIEDTNQIVTQLTSEEIKSYIESARS